MTKNHITAQSAANNDPIHRKDLAGYDEAISGQNPPISPNYNNPTAPDYNITAPKAEDKMYSDVFEWEQDQKQSQPTAGGVNSPKDLLNENIVSETYTAQTIGKSSSELPENEPNPANLRAKSEDRANNSTSKTSNVENSEENRHQGGVKEEGYTINPEFKELFEFDSPEDERKHMATMISLRTVSGIMGLLDKRGINQKTLAKYIAVSESYITQVFNGDKQINTSFLARIEKTLDVKFSFHIGSQPSPSNPSIKRPTEKEIRQGFKHKYRDDLQPAPSFLECWTDAINWILSIPPDK